MAPSRPKPPQPPQPPQIVEDPSVKTVFADTFIVAADHGGAISITLGDRRYLPQSAVPNGPTRVGAQTIHVAARVALTRRAATEMIRQLGAILEPASAAKPAKGEEGQVAKH
jgi:hypothetical protein